MGNICRSPAGEIIFQHLIEQENLTDEISCDSAGTIGFHSGSAPDPRMAQTLKKRDYRIFGKSRQFRISDFENYDLILAMDKENHAHLSALSKNSEHLEKLRLFCHFCTEHEETEVPDPYYGGNQGFELVADLIEDGAHGILSKIKNDSR
jgi:protein-tyrosine phosphatase